MSNRLDTNKSYKDEATGSIISKRSEYENYKIRMRGIVDINNVKKDIDIIKNDISEIKNLLRVITNGNTNN